MSEVASRALMRQARKGYAMNRNKFHISVAVNPTSERDHDISYRQVLRDYTNASFDGYDTYNTDVASYVGEGAYDCVQRYYRQACM